jgi:26S proteasome regulatory subunit N10
LKHRKNKLGGQRIIVFIGSVIDFDEKEAKKLGALMKKNGVALDVISLGEAESNTQILTALVESANSNNNSNLLIVPPGSLPSELLMTSPIYLGEGVMPGTTQGGSQFAEFGGMDPNLDPELALALRLSMEEAQRSSNAATNDAPSTASTSINATTPAQMVMEPSDGISDDDALLQQALALSMLDSGASIAPETTSENRSTTTSSLNDPNVPAAMDQEYLQSLLGSLPGVDLADPAMQAALAALQGSKPSDDEEKKEDKRE